jgi:lipopolysaccharide transport system permease protein
LPLFHYPALIDTMARFSLMADARRYFLGYLWWVIEPLLYVAVFYFVFDKLLGTRQPDFLTFLIVGKLTFIWFSKSLNQASNGIILNRGLIAQRNLPKAIFPLAVVHEGLYKQLAVFVLLIGLVLLDGYGMNWAWFWLLPVILTQYVLINACSLAAALLVCVQRDFVMVINLGVVFLLFVSGVFWDIDAISDPWLAKLLLTINPLAFLLDAYRSILMDAEIPPVAHLFSVFAASVAALLLLLRIYSKANFWIARRAVTL